jgi:hypothetical protein
MQAFMAPAALPWLTKMNSWCLCSHQLDSQASSGQAAFEQAMGLVWYYAENNPAMSWIGRRTLARIMAGEPSH